MSFGLEIPTAGSVIDTTTRVMRVREKGTLVAVKPASNYLPETWGVQIPSATFTDAIAIRPTKGVAYFSEDAYIGFNNGYERGLRAYAPFSVEYVIIDTQPGADTGWGLSIYGSDSSVLFSSEQNTFRVTTVGSVDVGLDSVDIWLPDIGDKFIILPSLFPTLLLGAYPSYGQGQVFNGVVYLAITGTTTSLRGQVTFPGPDYYDSPFLTSSHSFFMGYPSV